MLQALSLQGGSTLNGAAQTLMRAAVAAKLNALSDCVTYTLSAGDVVSQTNAALATCNRDRILAVAGQLDGFNNAGCPIDQHGRCTN